MMEWEGNYNVNYESRNNTVVKLKIYSENLFENFNDGTNVLLYLNRALFNREGIDQSIAYRLSTIDDFNIAVATRPIVKYAKNAQIIIPRLMEFEEKLREVYGDSKLIVGRDITGSIESDRDFYERFFPVIRNDLENILKLGEGAA